MAITFFASGFPYVYVNNIVVCEGKYKMSRIRFSVLRFRSLQGCSAAALGLGDTSGKVKYRQRNRSPGGGLP